MAKGVKLLICLICAVSVFGYGTFGHAIEYGDVGDVCEFKVSLAERVRYGTKNLLRTSTPIAECEIIPVPMTEHTEQNGYLLSGADGYINNIAKTEKNAAAQVNPKAYANMKKCFYLII